MLQLQSTCTAVSENRSDLKFGTPNLHAAGAQDQKRALREHFRAGRNRLSVREYRVASKQICVRASRHPSLRDAQVIFAYWPHVMRREIDLRPLLMYLHALGKVLALPVVREQGDQPTMIAARYRSEKQMTPNRWGILEPAHTAPIDAQSIDVIIVPALAADRNGTRLGYGGGFYDAFLRHLQAPTLCPILDACIMEHLESEPHDMPIDVLISESQTLLCRRTANAKSQ